MVCVDTSLVPFEDLPLQTTLLFDPPQSSLTASYLKSVCEAEGIAMSHRVAQQVYENAKPTSLTPGSRHLPHELTGDLRSSLNQLQLTYPMDHIVPTKEVNITTERNLVSDFKQAVRLSVLQDVCSFVECQRRGAKDVSGQNVNCIFGLWPDICFKRRCIFTSELVPMTYWAILSSE